MTDGELVRRVVAGESAIYGEIARRWYYKILAFCQSRLAGRPLHDAEDLTQEILLRGFRSLASLENPERFGPWLRGVARHVCTDWGRSKSCLSSMNGAIEVQSNCDSSSDQASLSDDRDLIWRELALMPEPLREVVLLHYYEDLTYDEIAKWLDVSRATVNERLAKARSLLRIRLAKLRSDV